MLCDLTLEALDINQLYPKLSPFTGPESWKFVVEYDNIL